jgi:hypothetical protein
MAVAKVMFWCGGHLSSKDITDSCRNSAEAGEEQSSGVQYLEAAVVSRLLAAAIAVGRHARVCCS